MVNRDFWEGNDVIVLNTFVALRVTFRFVCYFSLWHSLLLEAKIVAVEVHLYTSISSNLWVNNHSFLTT